MLTRTTVKAGLIGAGLALVLLWLVAVSYGAYRGHLAASFLERELARIQQAATTAAGTATPSSAPVAPSSEAAK